MILRSLVTFVAAILLLFSVPCYAINAKPKVPFIQRDICPFECCQYGKWTARSPLMAFKREGDDSNISFTIRTGEEFTAISGNVHIVKLGIIVINKAVGVFNKGDEIYILSYRGEGEYDLWFNGNKLRNTADVWAHGTLKQSPKFIWWVAIINKDGQQGWLKIRNISNNGFQTEDKVDGYDSCK